MSVSDTTQPAARCAFTPGPWEVEGDLAPSGPGSRPWVGRLEENRYSALSCGDTAAEALANARLIAAAPDLLAALDLLLSYEPGGNPPLTIPRGIAIDRAHAAIAKATGSR